MLYAVLQIDTEETWFLKFPVTPVTNQAFKSVLKNIWDDRCFSVAHVILCPSFVTTPTTQNAEEWTFSDYTK